MVHFAYSHVAFVTLLAFAAINSVQGGWMDVTEIKQRLAETEYEIPGVISELKAAEERVQNIKAKILSQNSSLRGELEKYTDCLETAYKYKWGETTFKQTPNYLYGWNDSRFSDTISCCKQEAFLYRQKMEVFPVDKCHGNLGSVNQEVLQQMQAEIEGVFYHNYLFSVHIFYKKLYTTQLKMLKEN
ncbi:unnamed protein product [Trichobilharzia szidati]|nr:unnamed protein product [Trichobilharzia szidati]